MNASEPLPITPSGNRHIITALCMPSKYPDAIPVAELCSKTIVIALLQILRRTGFPENYKQTRVDHSQGHLQQNSWKDLE